MTSTLNPHTSLLIRKLETITDLSAEERQALNDLQMTIRDLKTGQDIVRDGDRPSQCCLILEGFACRYGMTPNGKRQIFSFHIPGDIPDMQSIHLTVMDHSLGTIRASRVAFIPHENVRALCRRSPRIADVFWRDTLIDAAVFRTWMMGIGRRSAFARIAHLFCELYLRFKAVGLTNGAGFNLPITQAEIGDALGLSTVHVNRTLQELRGENLIVLRGGSLTVPDWEALKEAGEFDPTYLHLQDREAGAGASPMAGG